MLVLVGQRERLADDDVVAADTNAGRDDAVVLELVVDGIAHARARGALGLLERLDLVVVALALRVAVRAPKGRAKEAAVDRAPVENDRVLLVVAGVGGDGDDGVDAGGQLAEAQELHGACGGERLLRIEEDVRERVHANVIVGDVDAHGLLAHGALVGVTRRLVVIGKGYDAGAHAQYHRRMDLAVGVRGAVLLLLEVLGIHGDHARLLLERVHVLDHALGDQVLPRVGLGVALGLLELLDVAPLEQQFLLLDDEQRATYPARVS